ncbi:tyrosine-type recombinase/integrase [Mycolicibacterium arseniciresistens]|uniref:Site-specific integrase n=1 Tax=Mycolicibacterium arseniciresistens TaxID=3062257 RepID=A0ABT8UML2_9MYCO|nr:site-specific integrase [Mycolicibacterium arseniciresistens]MDO3637633.1 site-specific integrase [Mycolicibacterium arseniciresistens]
MAYIRAHDTKQRRNGKVVKRYVVAWREPIRDSFGLPTGELRSRQESYQNRETAEARRDELNAARHTTGTSALAEQRKAGDLPFGYYARGWLDAQAVKVARGRLKQRAHEDCKRLLTRYVLDRFGARAIASISAKDAEEFLAALVRQPSRQGDRAPLSPATVKHAWGMFSTVMRYAMRHGAISSNPADQVDFSTSRGVGDLGKFEHNPLTATQVGELCAAVAGEGYPNLPAYPVYGLMTAFLAYTGLRASENAGLEIRDLVFTTGPTAVRSGEPAIRCTVQVRRTKERRGGEWVVGTPKSKQSRRSVPLPPWLAEKLHAYLVGAGTEPAMHPRADEPAAPLWPSRKNGGGHRAEGQRYAVLLDWSEPLAMGTFYDTILKPALEAVGLPASRPAKDGEPAIRGVRLHDLRHTFATMHLMAGTHFMQVSRWLGHSTFTLTLNTYGDWIPEEDGGAINHLPEPSSAAGQTPQKVRQLFG